MSDGSAAQYTATYDARGVEMESGGLKAVLHWKTISWTRIVVDTLLVAGILLASASFLTVR
jgi:hypothetical protein